MVKLFNSHKDKYLSVLDDYPPIFKSEIEKVKLIKKLINNLRDEFSISLRNESWLMTIYKVSKYYMGLGPCLS